MYGIGLNVANVTANGEKIVSVMELGLCSSCVYEYDNSKVISICMKDNKIVDVLIGFNKQDMLYHDYNDLTEEEKEKYIPEAEYEFVTKDALGRYKSANIKYRKTGFACNVL